MEILNRLDAVKISSHWQKKQAADLLARTARRPRRRFEGFKTTNDSTDGKHPEWLANRTRPGLAVRVASSA